MSMEQKNREPIIIAEQFSRDFREWRMSKSKEHSIDSFKLAKMLGSKGLLLEDSGTSDSLGVRFSGRYFPKGFPWKILDRDSRWETDIR